MALIKCNECGKEISDKATTCIHCGNPIKKEIISKKNWKDLTSQEKNIIKKDLEEKNENLMTKKSLMVVVCILTIPFIIFMFCIDNIFSPFACLGAVIIFAITLSSYQKEYKKTYEKFFYTNNSNDLSIDTKRIPQNNTQQKNDIKKNKYNSKNGLLLGLILGIILTIIFFIILYIFLTNRKINLNNNKCLNNFYYNEMSDLCIQSNMLMPNDDKSCDDEYIYDDYDDKCYKYIITPPLNNDNLTYEENITRLNEYINQQ